MYPTIAFKLTAELMLVKVSASKSTRLLSNGEKKMSNYPIWTYEWSATKSQAKASMFVEVYESH